jgi:hypothetical protein
MHDATKVLLGTVRGSGKVVAQYDNNPATYAAGLVVSLDSSGDLSTDLSDGSRIGVSLGKSLSDTSKTAVCHKGLQVPIKVKNNYSKIITITSYANLINAGDDEITVGETVFVAQSGAATPGDATFRAATSNAATATSLATQINAHATAGALVEAVDDGDTVRIMILEEGVDTFVLSYSDEGTATIGATISADWSLPSIVKGAFAYIEDTSGLIGDATYDTVTITNAVFAESGTFTGVDEEGTTVGPVAIVDMNGGL